MAKRNTSINSQKKTHSHKTKKRLEAKKVMLSKGGRKKYQRK